MQQDIVPPNLDRVLIIAAGSTGQVANFIAGIEAIRHYHDGAHIVVFTNEENKRFLEKCPFINEVVSNWIPNGFNEEMHCASQLKRADFKIVYDFLQNNDTAKLFKRFWPQKPLWSGIANGCSHPHFDRNAKNLHPLDKIAEQLWLCGIGHAGGYSLGEAPKPNIEWAVDLKRSKELREYFHIHKYYALLSPDSPYSEPEQKWPTEKFIELAKELSDNDVQPIIIGTNKIFDEANEIVKNVPNALNLVGQLDIFDFISLAKRSCLAVGPDNDVMIITGFLTIPTVSLLKKKPFGLLQYAPRGSHAVSVIAPNIEDISCHQVINAARTVN